MPYLVVLFNPALSQYAKKQLCAATKMDGFLSESFHMSRQW